VFGAIRQAKPLMLYIAADGPRADKAGEAEKVKQVRRIATQVDWDCEVKTLFRSKPWIWQGKVEEHMQQIEITGEALPIVKSSI